MRKIIFYFATFVIALFCASAFAVPTADDHIEVQLRDAAKKLFFIRHMSDVVESMRRNITAEFSNTEANKEIIAKILSKYISQDKITQIMISVDAKYFSLHELRELTKAYSNPVIQEFLTKKASLMAKGEKSAVGEYLFRVQPLITRDIRQELLKQLRNRAEKGDVRAQYELAVHYNDNDTKLTFYWFIQAANNGSIAAMNDLGLMYSAKNKDYKTATFWYTKAAENGDTLAMFNLGLHFFYGAGTERDYKRALHWFQKAAYRDVNAAKFMLAKMYFLGIGVKKDEEQGLNWLTLVAFRLYIKYFDELAWLDAKERDKYINTFISYQTDRFLQKTHHDLVATDDMINLAKKVSGEMERGCVVDVALGVDD